MKIAAVICEYNPFHTGHKYQLETARSTLNCDAIVGVMSGNFVQRGDVSVYPKEYRAKAALAHGMDLVLELPAVLTLQSAERYARNAVMTLNALGCVDELFFGAECADTELLTQIARVLSHEDGDFRRRLRNGLSAGLSFAAARSAAIKAVLGSASAEILSQPNNILAVEYIKALIQFKSPITPFAIARKGTGHHTPTPQEGFASATAIREMLTENPPDAQPYLPFQEQLPAPHTIKSLEKPLLANLCLLSPEQLQNIADVSEGLEYALKRAAFSANTLPDLLNAVKSKRYAYSRLRRIVLNAYLGITHADTKLMPSYIRILDFNDRGQKVLNHARGTATLPLAKHGGQIKEHPDALALWQRELNLDRIYHLFTTELFSSH